MTVWRTLVLIAAVAIPGWGGPMDLAPAMTSTMERYLSDVAGDNRGVLIRAESTFDMGGAGIRFDPLLGGLSALRLSLFHVTGSTGTDFALGGEIASANVAVADAGMRFYDVPLSWQLIAGSLYYLAFSDASTLPDAGWGKDKNEMEFYAFEALTSSPFTVANGLSSVSVLDGGAFPSSLGGFGNLVMPHVRLFDSSTAIGGGDIVPDPPPPPPAPPSVPEPSTWSMIVVGAALLGYGRKRARSSAAILASSSRLRRSV